MLFREATLHGCRPEHTFTHDFPTAPRNQPLSSVVVVVVVVVVVATVEVDVVVVVVVVVVVGAREHPVKLQQHSRSMLM